MLSYPLTALPIASVVSAFTLSNFAGQAIVIILFVGSIFAWSTVVTKWKELAQAWRVTQRFLAAYRKESHPVALFLKRQRFDASPLYGVYEQACKSLGSLLEPRGGDPSADLFVGSVESSGHKLSNIQLGVVRNTFDRMMAEKAALLERGMGFVALTTTTAPLLGLLGTVWGAMEAFEKATSSGGAAMLSSVAPGISGALLTTVIGLLVAIPSGIGYNMLTDRIRGLCVEMDNFSQEMLSNVERHYLNPE